MPEVSNTTPVKNGNSVTRKLSHLSDKVIVVTEKMLGQDVSKQGQERRTRLAMYKEEKENERRRKYNAYVGRLWIET